MLKSIQVVYRGAFFFTVCGWKLIVISGPEEYNTAQRMPFQVNTFFSCNMASRMILASQQLFEYYGNSFKSSPNPCELEHVNPTFIWCLVIYFPSWWSKEEYKRLVVLELWWKKKEDSSGEVRGVPGWGDSERKAFALMRPFLQWRSGLSLLWRCFSQKPISVACFKRTTILLALWIAQKKT